MLEITEREHNELLLSAKNLQELGLKPFSLHGPCLPYIALVIPYPPPEEGVKGEHFVLADILKSILGSSSQAGLLESLKSRSLKGPGLASSGMISYLWENKTHSLPPRQLIGMNHACISVEFSVFFIAKMHDSQSFSLISH